MCDLHSGETGAAQRKAEKKLHRPTHKHTLHTHTRLAKMATNVQESKPINFVSQDEIW